MREGYFNPSLIRKVFMSLLRHSVLVLSIVTSLLALSPWGVYTHNDRRGLPRTPNPNLPCNKK
jgi:hypothetical protein